MVFRILMTAVAAVLLCAGLGSAGTVGVKLSGDGVLNDTTVKAGLPVSVDFYIENDSLFTGFAFGFALTSPDSSVKRVIHVADSGNGLNPAGDIKGFNGWQDQSVWNFGGVYAVESDWNGEMPELLGFGGLCVQNEYKPHPYQKVLSFRMIVPETGLMQVDSAFYPPGGYWMLATPNPDATQEPAWKGPLVFRVVKE
ncbi:MAG TPA: hypothetical protein PKW75_10230 [candidate division Zixibacteria bacterium]|nr:hypothetical protein [candidate division Zixibacteria bacterium]MDD4917107.1 hypothetical protein [candidate division Zixibacteria bacterium]MDM7972709.1 hypothetical protein [candidate division Zixibacteria bacterium]HOD67688.1 hypothetical protein [candidate division Zixibacteria bacterium]HOZ08651.1 hypothetical protein [candidate division Zixibacteria bacterium]